MLGINNKDVIEFLFSIMFLKNIIYIEKTFANDSYTKFNN